jgi:hypothetical protein
MIFTLGTTDVRTKTYNNYDALERDLLLCEAGSVFAGQKKGTENAWNMIAVTDPDSGEYFGLGLLTATNKEPHILSTENNMLFVGADNFVVAFDIAARQVRSIIPMPSDFVDFFYIANKGMVFMVHKKGVIVKDDEAQDIWRVSRGNMSGYSLEKNLFVMELASGRTVAFKISNGKEVNFK